jgi:hypothetical protein
MPPATRPTGIDLCGPVWTLLDKSAATSSVVDFSRRRKTLLDGMTRKGSQLQVLYGPPKKPR